MITIVEGADFAGKTTYCLDKCWSHVRNGERSAYIHFPIRKNDDVIISDLTETMFTECGELVGDMTKIQHIILENIIVNAKSILALHSEGYNVYVDRYLLSNIVYRQLHNIPMEQVVDGFVKILMRIAKHEIMVHDDEVLKERCKANTIYGDELDTINEQLENVLKANHIYATYHAEGNNVWVKKLIAELDIKQETH